MTYVIGKNVLESPEQETPLQKQIAALAGMLSKAIAIIVFIILGVGLLLGYDPREMVIVAIAIAVAAIPEGLVITLTVILTIGMRRILSKKAVVRTLISAETLGSVSVVCTDKTGTITEGRLTVVEGDFRNNELGILSGVLCNNRIDSLETSLYNWIMNSPDPLTQKIIESSNDMNRLDGIPFAHPNKFTATLNVYGDKNIVFIFGAPEKVLERCRIDHVLREEWQNRIEAHGSRGQKIVGFAYKLTSEKKLTPELLQNLEWNGIIVYEDPIRDEIRETIQRCQSAGIAIKMITGDIRSTAIYVGEQVGLIPLKSTPSEINDYVLTGDELRKLTGKELEYAVLTASVFARIDPLEKYQIVQVLQQAGEVVAMTGDGVNDAPALKVADIGVVVNEASDISKSTADIVLLDSNLTTIAHAVREGRVIFANIRKVVSFLLSGGFTEIFLIIGALAFQLPLPVTAAQLLWVNLIEDSLPALALAFEKDSKGIMEKPPRKKSTPIFNTRMKILLCIYIVVSDGLLLSLFYYLNNAIHDINIVRSIIFLGIGIDSLFAIYAFKSLRRSIFTYNPFSNWFLNFSVIFGVLMFGAALYLPFFNSILGTVPLPLNYVLLMMGFGIGNLLLVELIKHFTISYLPDSE